VFKHNIAYRFMFAMTLTITLTLTVSFIWDYRQQKQQVYEELREKAKVITMQLLATREFIALNQDKINYDSRGNFEFKALNPAAVGTGLGAIFASWTDYSIKQTRINARNPNNIPDSLEREVLLRFSNDHSLKEVWWEEQLNGKPVFRYLTPLKVNESCQPCHGEPKGQIDIAGYPKEGYQLGDLAGAISITMPMEKHILNLRSNLMRHFGFMLLLLSVSLAFIYIFINRLVANPLKELKKTAAQIGAGNLDVNIKKIETEAEGEIKQFALQFQDMADQLSYLYSNLEQKVAERTNQLKLANDALHEKQLELHKVNLQLSQASEHKSRFLAAVSHELRTPLTAIIAFSELLLASCSQENELTRQNLEGIKSNSENLLGMINNLLDLARIEAGRNELCLETMDIVDVINSVERIISPLAMKKKIRFKTGFVRDIPLTKAEPEKIRRAIVNLATNAVQFTPEGGEVEIQVDFNADTREILVMVRDTGIGIKKEDQDIIFERFRQVEGVDRRSHRGTGLGLTIAKELIELHGGWISIKSQLKEGSTFTIGLPLNSCAGEGENDSRIPDPAGGR